MPMLRHTIPANTRDDMLLLFAAALRAMPCCAMLFASAPWLISPRLRHDHTFRHSFTTRRLFRYTPFYHRYAITAFR